jgi:hypothetical protein
LENPISGLGPGGALGLLRHHLSEAALGESVRHRYGRSFISTPMPTIPSMINISSPKNRSGEGHNQKHQTVMIVTGAASDWEYLSLATNQSLKSAFSGGSHD